MPLTSQPTRADQPSSTGIGRSKSDDVAHPATDLDVDYPAAEHEKIKDYLIDVCGEVGNHVGTAGSLNTRVDAAETSIAANSASITALQVGATAPADVTKAAAAAGSSTHAARVDHKHDVSTASAGNIDGRSNAEGTATSLARSDHKHEVVLVQQSLSSTGALNATTGLLYVTANAVQVNLPAPSSLNGLTPVVIVQTVGSFFTLHRNGSENINGSAGDLSCTGGAFSVYQLWTNGTDWFLSLMVPTSHTAPQVVDAGAASGGSSILPAAVDHKHSVLTDTPIAVGRSNSGGSNDALARADHIHDGGQVSVDYATHLTTNLSDTDFLNVDTSGGNVSLALPATPALSDGRQYTLKKTTTDTNKITITPPGAVNVEGANAAFDLPNSTATNRPAWTLVYDSNNDEWWVL